MPTETALLRILIRLKLEDAIAKVTHDIIMAASKGETGMNDETNQKMLYIWRLATFLHSNGKHMAAQELVDHLNRNNFKTQRGAPYLKVGKGPFAIIAATWRWVHNELGLEEEAEHIALAYVQMDGRYAYDKAEPAEEQP
jgi:hypothetical protein